MTDEMIALGRRAVACSKWKWLDGMRDFCIHEERYNAEHEGFLEVDGYGLGYIYKGLYPNSLPDFSDPATLGCLLALVREAWDDEWLTTLGYYNSYGGKWFVHGGKLHGVHFLENVSGELYPSEAEALVVALEAANAI